MAPRRSADSDNTLFGALETALEVVAPAVEKVVDLDVNKVRKWADVAMQIQKLREGGATVPEICDTLNVSYVLVNQLILRSYKFAVDSTEVFERQEKMRLNIDE